MAGSRLSGISIRCKQNSAMKILSVFGTRPEAVKMAPVVQQLAQTPGIELRVCVTAQHRQMLDQVLNLFDIRPDYDLDLMRDDQSLAEMSAAIFTHLDPVLADFNPDWVLGAGRYDHRCDHFPAGLLPPHQGGTCGSRVAHTR